MEFTFDISNPLCLANLRAAAAASKLVYSAPNITSGDGESALIQDCGNCIVVAFPGTHDVHDILGDLDALWRPVLIGSQVCSVHKGFDDSLDAIWPAMEDLALLKSDKPVFITGHSKGAAIAKRFALKLMIGPRFFDSASLRLKAVITFGEPRGGDARYAALYNSILGQRSLRVTNAADPVPWLPGWLAGNRHCGPEGYLPPGENQIVDGPRLWWKVARNCGQIYSAWKNRSDPLVLLTDHHIASYIRRLDALN